MKAQVNQQAEQYIRQVKTRKRLGSIVAVLSVLVALITTYVLILPGITMENTVVCGLEEHVHTGACYANAPTCGLEEGAQTVETLVMSCSFQPHEHSEQCRNDLGELICGKATGYWHTHDELCTDAQGSLICTLTENQKHRHSDSCYGDVATLVCQTEETEGHGHTEECKTREPADEPACGLEENPGHVHGDSCTETTLTCTTPETAGHAHDASCTRTETTLFCTTAEGEGAHSHNGACYTEESVLTCTTAEGEGAHSHNGACYTEESVLTCTTAEGEGAHSHGGDCYTEEDVLTCTIAEGEGAHAHGEDCYTEKDVLSCADETHDHTEGCYTRQQVLTCEAEETAGHAHSDSCYTAESRLTCKAEETAGHAHSDSCYTAESRLTCKAEETAGHAHSDSCYTAESRLTCETEETAGHAHGESCYTTTETIICGMEAGQGAHAHTDACYSAAQVCGKEEGEGAHTHTDGCYPLRTVYTCGKQEGEGAHAHDAECFTTAEELTCTLLHQHESDCFEKDETGRDCAVCGMEETPVHQHSESCLERIVNTTLGHTHTETCYGTAQICGLEAHQHSEECYGDPEATATPEVTEAPEATATPEVTEAPEATATPEVTEAPEATPTPEVTEAPEATATPEVTATPEPTPDPTYCGIPEHRHSADCLSEAGELSCGYAMDHLHGELCYTQLADPVYYCGMEEHLHGYLCFDESLNIICGHADEHRHSYECLEDAAAVEYYCGLEEHFHQELCYDENWALTCTQPEHFHSEDCRYACGIPAHTHSADAAGGMMLLTLEESFGCYDAEGSLICTLQEHTHSEACNAAADTPVGNDDQMLLGNGTTADFGNYVTDVNVHTDGKYDDYYKPTYDPVTNSYATAIDIKFNIPNTVLMQDKVYNFTYDLPRDVGVTNADTYGDVYDITNASGVKVGEFQIKRNSDGTHYLDIRLDPDKVDTSTNCTGTLYFNCSIDGSATREDGSIYVEFEQNIGFDVGGSDINRDDGETALYSVSTEKTGAHNGTAYDPATGTLTYQVSVKTKGTPGEINLVDTLNASGVTIESQQITSVKLTNNWQTTDVTNYTASQNGNSMNITLPQVHPNSVPDGQEAEYLITYQVKLADTGYGNTYINANNSITATSGAGTPNEVRDNDSISENHEQKMLEKTGSYDASTQTINWTVVFNQGNKNISGMTLTDQMLGSLPNASSVTITPNDGGYAIQYGSDGSISGIRFQNNTTSTYQITYQTKPSKDFAGNYAEANKVTVLDPNNQPVVDDEYTVNNINRNQRVSKTVAGSTTASDKKSMTIDWKVEIPIDEDGLSNDVQVTDNMNPDGRHYMTYDQLMNLYNQVSGMLAKDQNGKTAMTVKVITQGANGTGGLQTRETNIEDVLAQADSSALFSSVKFTLDDESAAIASLKNTTLTFNYSSTAYTDGLTNNTQFSNWLGVGEGGNSTAQAGVDFVADNTNPVSKYCGDDGNHNSQETCNWTHQGNDPFSYGISVYQNDTYDYIRVEDTLPEGVDLVDVYLGQNLQTKLGYDASAAPDGSGFYPLTLTPNGDTSGLAISGRYNPQTRKLIVDVRPDGVNQIFDSFGKGRTLKLKVRASVKADYRPAPGESQEYTLPNTASVYVSQNNSETFYDEDSHTYKLKLETPRQVVKMDMNWQQNDSYIQNYKADNFGWIVEVTQDKEYDQIVVTDTLPEGIPLWKIAVGSSTIEVVENQDGTLTLTPHLHTDEEGLSLVPVYNPSTRQVTITIKRNPDSALKDDPNHTRNYGVGEKLTLRYYFTLPEDHLASEENPSVSNRYKNTVSVDMTKDNNTTTSEDDQTITTQFTYSPPVVKYGVNASNQATEGNVTINNATGQLVWKVLVRKADLYDYVIIEDQLPAGMVELDSTKGEGVIQLKQYSGYWLRLGESTDGGTTYPLIASNQHNQNENLYGYEATYNAKTGRVYIKLNYDPWQRNGVLENETTLTFHCRVTEEYMPNTADGQYSKELGEVTNNVTVTTNEGELGHDGQTQIVTVTQQRPNFTAVDKNSPVFDGNSKTLHYSVDINPEQQDMDPAKNQITIVDVASYSQNQPYVQYGYESFPAGRKMTLKTDSVKLYYADYDEYGQPLMEDGRLVPGELVDSSKWTMEYEEDDRNDNATRTITLTVPDSRALVLVYDYAVSMNTFFGLHNNTPLDIDNRIYAEGYEGSSDSSETSSQDKWNASAGGGFIEGSAMQLIKHDAANQSNVLQGVQFELQQYVDGAWAFVQNMTTDAEGQLRINPPTEISDIPSYERLYRVVETQSITGYEVPDPAPSYLFCWSQFGGVGIECPSDVDISTVPNLQDEAVTFYAPNAKKATSLSVEKVWLNPDGSLMSDRDKPSSVTVDLHRYAIPEAAWQQLVQETDGKINGAMVGGGTNTNVTIQIKARQDYAQSNDITTTVEALVGSTLSFDVRVMKGGIQTWQENYGFSPVFSGYEASSYQLINGEEWYHFDVPVTENLALSGVFWNQGANYAWGTNNVHQYTSIENVSATRGLPADNAVYASQLAPYIDRSYVLSMKLTSAGSWQGLWENLDLEGEDENGNKVHYKYYVSETAPSGYAVKITGYSSDNGGEFVVENQKDGSRTEKTNLRIKKRWFGARGEEYVYDKNTGLWTDTNGQQYVYENNAWYTVSGDTRTLITDQQLLGQLPLSAVSIRLLRKDLLAGSDARWENYVYNQNASTVINDRTNWTYNFTNLPTKTYNSLGQLVESYDYFIEEIIDGDFIVELVPSGTEQDADGREYDVITVKNSAVRNVSIKVDKRWAEGSKPEGSPEVTVVLGRQIYTENGYVNDDAFAAEAGQNGWQTQVTLSDQNQWMYQWDGLPNGAAGADGTMKSYSYTVTETMVNGKPVENTIYDVSYEYGTDGSVIITNTKVIPKTEVTAEKVWQNETGAVTDAPAGVASVTLKLMRRAGESGTPEQVSTVELNAANRWRLTVSDLEKFVPVNGEPSDAAYVYYFEEDPVPDGYSVSYSNSADGVSFAAPENGWVTVTNRLSTDLSITKLWQNTKGESAAPTMEAVYVKLYRDGSEYSLSAEQNGVTLKDGYIVLSAANSWKTFVKNLPETDGNGRAYSYSIKEYRYENWQYTEVSGAAISPASGSQFTPFTITNTVTGVGLEKKWQNADGTAYTPESGTTLTFTLMRRSSWGGNDAEVQKLTLDGSEETPWTVQLDGLPAGGQSGETYSYYFVEENPGEGFGVAYSNSPDGSTFSAVRDETITVTNTKHQELKVEKVWANPADATGSVQFELYQVKTPVGGSGNTGSGDTVTDVTYTFNIVYHQVNTDQGVDQYQMLESVQRTFKSNETIIWKPAYSHDESAWGNYRPSGSPNTITSDKGETFTFVESSSSSRPFVFSFNLGLAGTENKTITWETNNWFWGNRYYKSDGMDGDYYVLDNWTHQFETSTAQSLSTRAAEGGTLVGTYTLDASNGWALTFNEEDLPLLSDGQYTYTYYVKEVGMDGYTVVYDNNEGVNSGVITITNTKDQPDVVEDTTTSLTLAKQWVNAEGCMPQSLTFTVTQQDTVNTAAAAVEHTVTVDLTQNLPAASCQTLTSLGAALNVTAGEGGGFTLTIQNLPDTHTVNGVATQDYAYTAAEQPLEGFTTTVSGDAQNGYTFVNTATKLEVEKKWANSADATGSVQFELYQVKTPIGGSSGEGGGSEDPVEPAPVEVTYTFRIQVEQSTNSYRDMDVVTHTFKSNEYIIWKPTYTAPSGWGDYHPSGISISSNLGDSYPFVPSSSTSQPYSFSFDLGLAGETGKTITWLVNDWYWGNQYDGSEGYENNWTHQFETSTAQSYAASTPTGGVLIGTYTLNAGNGWHMFFTQQDIPLEADDQYTYTYYVKEVGMDGYTVVYDNNEGINSGLITITNTKDEPVVEDTTTSLTLAKQWVNAEGCMPQSLTFTVTQQDTVNTAAAVEHTVTVDLTQNPPAASCQTLTGLGAALNVTAGEGGGFTLTIQNLPDTHTINGVTMQDYAYTATEQPLEGFTTTVSGDEQNGYTFVNTATQLSVEKKWGEGAAQQPVQFRLWRKTGSTTEPEPGEPTITCPGCHTQITEGASGHEDASCGTEGHYACDGADHSACNSGPVTITCPGCHAQITEGASGHEAASCGVSGHYVCDGRNHSAASCGNTTHTNCDGLNHAQCTLCWNGYVCSGGHGQGICNGGSSTGYTCANCHSAMSNATDHDAVCGTAGHYNCDGRDHGIADCQASGHYKCDGNAHSWCGLCNGGFQCNGSHGEGVCNGTSGGEQPSGNIDITFTVGNGGYWEDGEQKLSEDTHTETGIPAGATVTWRITLSQFSNQGWAPSGDTQFTYDGVAYPVYWTYDSGSQSYTASVSFPASVSGSIYFVAGSGWQKATISQQVSYTEAAAASAKGMRIVSARAASETVDTTGATELGTYSLSEGNSWQHIFYGLPMADENGNAYLYFVEELGADHYIVSYQNNSGIAPGGESIIITNDKPDDVIVDTTTNLTLLKQWVGDYRPDSLTFRLTQQDALNGAAAPTEHVITVDLTVQPPAATSESLAALGAALTVTPAGDGTDGWTMEISGLPDTRTVNGATTVDYTYTLTEDEGAGFTAAITGDEATGFTATNTTTKLEVEKKWANEADATDSIQFELYQIKTPIGGSGDEGGGSEEPEEPTPVEVTYTFQIMVRQENGSLRAMDVITRTFQSNEYIIWKPTYALTLDTEADWHQTFRPNGENNTITSDQGESFTFTESANTVRPFTYAFDLGLAGTAGKTITWVADNWYWGNQNTEGKGAADDWTHQFETSTVQSYATRTPTGGELIGTYTLNAGNSWYMAFTQQDIPLGADDQYSYTYYVREVGMDGYTVVYDGNEGIASGKITITNSKDDVITTTTADVAVTKVWQGAGDYKPQSLTFRLTQQDTVNTEAQPAEHVITVDLTQTPPAAACGTLEALGAAITLTPAEDGSDSWAMQISGLPDTHAVNGIKSYDYTYTLTEDPVEGFTAEITGDEETGFTVTNTRSTTSAAVEKQWAENTPDDKPAVTMTLYRYIGQEGSNVGVMVEEDGLTNPITLDGTETQPWHGSWTNLPTHGTYSYELNGQTTTLTGAYTYYVLEDVPEGYAAASTPEDGTLDENGKVVIVNTPSRLNVVKLWEGYTAQEAGETTVYVQLKDAQGNTVDPSLYATGVTPITLNGLENCFELGYSGIVSFRGLPHGEYTAVEVAYRIGEGAPVMLEETVELPWKVTNGEATLPETVGEEVTATITNTKRTQLGVEKVWGSGTQKQTMRVQLWRIAEGTPQGVACPGCGVMVITDTAHLLSCGHYTCAEGYQPAEHAACTCGQSHLCQPGHSDCVPVPDPIYCPGCEEEVSSEGQHLAPCGNGGHYTCDGVAHTACQTCGQLQCNGAEHTACPTCGNPLCNGEDHTACGGVEDVTIGLELWCRDWNNGPASYYKTISSITVPDGSNVVWRIRVVKHWNNPQCVDLGYASGDGILSDGFSCSRESIGNGEYVFTLSFPAQAGTIRMVCGDPNAATNEATWSSDSVTATAAASARTGVRTRTTRATSNASETVNTIGAEKVQVIELTETGGWQQMIYDLPAVNEQGIPYLYFVEELDAEDYVVSYSNNAGVAPDGSLITVTNNQPEAQTVSLTVNKRWQDAEGNTTAAPNYAVHYELWAVGADAPAATGVLNQDNGWTATHTGLDPAVTYFVVETSVRNGNQEMLTLYDPYYQAGEGESSETAVDAAVTGGGTVAIINRLTPTYRLPETGGSGTHLYTGAGALLILVALTLLYKGNKGKRRADA